MLIKKLLIGIDDSKFSEHAAKYGFDIARSFKAEVGLVHIVTPMILPMTGTDTMTGMPVEPFITADPGMISVQSEQSDNLIERTINNFGADLQVTHFTEYGTTADGIIRCSKEFKADMIVIGTHHRTGIDRLLMGSVAEHVVRHAEVPVLVVPFMES